MFDQRFAQRMARRYRKQGLDKTARRMVGALTEDEIQGASVLEIGGGLGEIHVELLKRGAARATNLELSSAYDDEAQRLVDDAGLDERVDRRILDIAANPEDVEPADIVMLHRVVCCYPDYLKLLTAVASHARRQVVFSYPPRNAGSRAFIAVQNLFFRLQGSQFRVFAHPPASMFAVFADHGLEPLRTHKGPIWWVASARRES
jgi:magnesium-protoporphyrin O-methyltransferase